jgi:Flp pilus assembly pilin Flp
MFTALAQRAWVAASSLLARDDEGQTLAEYGMIMGIVAVAVIVAAGLAFQGAIVARFDAATTCLSGGAGC